MSDVNDVGAKIVASRLLKWDGVDIGGQHFELGSASGFAWNEKWDCYVSFNKVTGNWECDSDWTEAVGFGSCPDEAFDHWKTVVDDFQRHRVRWGKWRT